MIRTHTTRYVTLLSVVLALALTAALAACGSDEPSGVTGPDRTASTPTETPTTTGSGDTPTATVAPVPATATAPPAASGSAETDREALVVLYNATDGENWNRSDNWLSDAPLGEWEGVTTNNDGRVTELRLVANDLRGEIPAELGSLSNLEVLWLQRLEQPAELGSLSNLIHNNRYLMGEIPAELGRLSNLVQLDLSGNPFMEGEIPPELGSLSNLEAEPQSERVEWGDTAGAGQAVQTRMAGSQSEQVERGDTAGAGQAVQPDDCDPRPQVVPI